MNRKLKISNKKNYNYKGRQNKKFYLNKYIKKFMDGTLLIIKPQK